MAMVCAKMMFAQQGFYLGGRLVAPQSTWLMNKNDADEGPELDWKSTIGVAGGIAVGYNVSDNMGFEMNILFSGQGQKYEGKIETKDQANTTIIRTEVYTAQTKLMYMKLPLLFKVNTNPESTVGFTFFTGPQFDFLMGCKEEYNGTYTGSAGNGSWKSELDKDEITTTYSPSGASSSTSTTKLSGKPYKGFGVDWVLGLGAQFNLSENFQLTATFRADYGLGDAEDKDCKLKSVTNSLGTVEYKDSDFVAPSSIFLWDNKESKFNSTDLTKQTGVDKSRAATKRITGGLQLGFNYLFN